MSTAAPNPGRRIAIIVGALIALVAIGAGTWSIVGQATTKKSTTAVSVTREQSDIPVSTGDVVRHLVVDIGSGDLTLHAAAGTAVTGTRTVENGLGTPTFSEKLTGDTLTVKARCPSLPNSSCSVSYDLNVPADATVQAKSSVGDLAATGVVGDMTLDTSSGDVSVSGAKGRLNLSSQSGNVKVGETRSTDVTARSDAGDVKASLLEAPTNIDLSTDAGSATLEVPRSSGAYNIDASTSAGDRKVDVDTSASSPRKVRLRSSAGDVRVIYSATAG